MKTQPFRFSFTLDADNDDKCIIKEFRFDVTYDEADKFIEELDAGEGDLLNSFLDFQAEQELEFGGHHCAQAKDDFLGFDTDEVPEERIFELMNIWRNYFISKGFKCSDVIDYSLIENEDKNDCKHR